MPFYKRRFKFPRHDEKHSILWKAGGIVLILAIVKLLIE